MGYDQLTSGERHALSALRRQGFSQAGIARALERKPEHDQPGAPAAFETGPLLPFGRGRRDDPGRRSRSRRNRRFRGEDPALVCSLLEQLWSPEQITGRLARAGALRISHETIYRYVWEDRRRGGLLYRYLRGAQKKKWKRYRSYDSRGRLAGKRPICDRPAGAENRSRAGHSNGLIRQYLPKRQSMARVTQAQCDRIAAALNHRPRKRLGFLTPAEIYENQPQ